MVVRVAVVVGRIQIRGKEDLQAQGHQGKETMVTIVKVVHPLEALKQAQAAVVLEQYQLIRMAVLAQPIVIEQALI
jgi:hypothetical protein